MKPKLMKMYAFSLSLIGDLKSYAEEQRHDRHFELVCSLFISEMPFQITFFV